MFHQLKAEWCWAAVSKSVQQFFQSASHNECEIVGRELHQNCCGDLSDELKTRCKQPHELDKALKSLGLLDGQILIQRLNFETIRAEIDSGKPVCVLIKWQEGGQFTGGHFIALTGYRITSGGMEYVHIDDPFYGESMMRCDRFSDTKGGYRAGAGVWFASYKTQPSPASV